MTAEPSAAADDVVLVHSSDLHLARAHGADPDLSPLRQVLAAARDVDADVLLLAGDVFDHNRVKLPVLDSVTQLLGEAGLAVVILPGNHDCLSLNSVYCRGGLADPDNVSVLGITAEHSVTLPKLDLQIWGRPHRDESDMAPLRETGTRTTRHHVVTAHGHWFSGPHDRHRSWLIRNEELAEVDADYIALGHWDVAQAVGDGRVPAYYSGSPDQAGTVNVVRFALGGAARVRRHLLRDETPG